MNRKRGKLTNIIHEQTKYKNSFTFYHFYTASTGFFRNSSKHVLELFGIDFVTKNHVKV